MAPVGNRMYWTTVSARSKARRRALDILFEADIRDMDPMAVLADHERRRVVAKQPPLNPYTTALVTGVAENLRDIDMQLSKVSRDWDLDRMPRVDRNVLRIGAYEISYSDDVPDGVAIAEAVALVKDLSTDESPGFTNGILAAIAAE